LRYALPRRREAGVVITSTRTSTLRGFLSANCSQGDNSVSVYNPEQLLLHGWLMSPAQSTNVWVPVCCDRVMRYNMFVPKGGAAYGALVCTVCSKNVTFELESLVDLNAYGEGSRVLNMLGSPKPPKVDRPKAAGDAALNDQTL
jgi:hypothetical protein